ncbi:ribokinase [Salmonella enterica]|uniref:Ribokinase n=1 Tax=Salmonella enterica TaxID=28901 RepID=A0A3J8T3C6_SALER|nr:ribokinase [Salmonella enterica subsp. enterica serovar Oranienburg]EAX0788340.1 ribokinase [Salmonella enterica]OIV02765.1 ribokinase [Salmonella enterica subsp. houtenae]EAX0792358.1 ribokinase [Salmonella enterica]EBI8449475.1 ribokinase [Salmonella enterica]
MLNKERHYAILTWLNRYERATVNHLAKLFGVTKETIRNDLNTLSREGCIERCHGGAIIKRRIFHTQSVNNLDTNIMHFFDNPPSKKTVKSQHKGRKMKGKVCILGSFNVDIIANVDRFPQSGESIFSENTVIGPGGKGANQALAVSKCHVKTHFVGKVGNDQFSQLAYEHLSSSDIDSFMLYQDKQSKTGTALIYVCQSDGENMIAISPGANQSITADEVEAITSEVRSSDVFLTQLENNLPATFRAIEIARRCGTKVVLDPAPYSPHVINCLQNVDFLTPNETEASLLSGIQVTDISSAKTAAKAIKAKGVGQVIITMGAKGALIYDGHEFTHVPALKALCVDTTGAGDAFNGAYTAAMAKGQSILQAVKFACAFASLAVEKEGASNMPEYKDVLTRLAQYEHITIMTEKN